MKDKTKKVQPLVICTSSIFLFIFLNTYEKDGLLGICAVCLIFIYLVLKFFALNKVQLLFSIYTLFISINIQKEPKHVNKDLSYLKWSEKICIVKLKFSKEYNFKYNIYNNYIDRLKYKGYNFLLDIKRLLLDKR